MANHHNNCDETSFEITSKRRKGLPSETRVGKGTRVVHGTKELSRLSGTFRPTVAVAVQLT
jgi:hypothetical protein